MADEEHLAIFKKGVESWNEWRSSIDPRNGGDGTLILPDLSGVNFSDYYDDFDLSRYDFTETNLSKTYLSEANLSEANLWGANLSEAHLWGGNLSKANLIGTKLTKAILNDAILNKADLIEAELSKAELVRTQALGTNFERATFTGACIEDWNTNSATNLNGVICDYIYLKGGEGVLPLVNPQERRPSIGNFAPGEFTKLFQKARETVDLIFLNGIDWEAFLVSFPQLQVQAGDKALFIQAIENKNDGAFVIRVSVPPELDKAEIEKCFKQKYQIALKARDEQYRKHLQERLRDKDNLIEIYREQITFIRQDNTQLIGIIKTMAEKETSKKEYTFHAPVGSVENQGHIASSGNQNNIGNAAGEAQAELKSIQHIHNPAPEQKQTLAEAAAEIQQLLKQLEQANPGATEAEKNAYVTASVPPTLRARTVSALKAGGKEALKELLDNPYVNIGLAIVEGWQSPE